MYINEIAVGAGIQITVAIGMQTMEFTTSVSQVFNDCIYAEPIFKNDKMIGFSTKGLVLSMITTDAESGRAWQFINISIRNIRDADGNLFHEIKCKNDAKAINRRGACRVWIGEPGLATTGMGKPPIDVTVKDISISGISFLCDRDNEIPDGSVVHIDFRDSVTKTRFSISAIVVRREDTERARVVYGCKLNQESPAIAKYVNEKQREKLKAARQMRVKPLIGKDK